MGFCVDTEAKGPPERGNGGKLAPPCHTCTLTVPLMAPSTCLLPSVCPSLLSDSSPLPMQERLRHIGPEEFVQAFVNKDPLAGTKVKVLGRAETIVASTQWRPRKEELSWTSSGEARMLPRAEQRGHGRSTQPFQFSCPALSPRKTRGLARHTPPDQSPS